MVLTAVRIRRIAFALLIAGLVVQLVYAVRGQSPEIVSKVLADGADAARRIASAKMELVRERMGIGGQH